MKKTFSILALVMVTAACILFACKKMQNSENSLEAKNGLDTKNSKLRANALACTFVDLTGTLTTQTLVNTNIYRINGIVRIPSGVTVTVPAGTVFYGVKSSSATAWLVIEKGGKLIATGTAGNPIVFTSDQAPGSRAPGDWGGIAFAGNAPVNSSTLGITLKSTGTPTYTLTGGGSISADNSGNLQYVQMFFAGKGDSGDDRSRAGLLLNAVGSATAIDHVQISNSLYDSFAAYGGTVKQNYLVSYNAGRTDYRISYGYKANMQFVAAMRLNNTATPPANAYGLDISNDPSGSTNVPLTQPVISNITVMGPNFCSGTAISSNFRNAVHFFNNGAGKIYNSVFSSWNSSATPSGLAIDGIGSIGQTATDDLEFSYNSFHNSGATPYSSSGTWSSIGCDANIAGWITGSGGGTCDETGNQLSVTTLGYNSSFCADYCSSFTSNFTLGTTTLGNANFSWDSGSAFTHPTYRGAFGSTDFTSGWTEWCAQSPAYCQ